MKTIVIYFALIMLFSQCNSKTEQSNEFSKTTEDSIKNTAKQLSENLQNFEELNFDKKKLSNQEKTLIAEKIKGVLVDGKKWRDARGENIALFSEQTTFTKVPEAEGESYLSIYLHTYHFVIENNNYKLIREVKDFEKDCFFDNRARFIEESFQIFDLDGNNFGELFFMYRLGCSSDISPDPIKLMMLENGEKYAIRGTTLVYIAPNEPEIGGEKQIDPEFTKIAPQLSQKASEIWENFKIANSINTKRNIYIDAIQKYVKYAIGGVEPIWKLSIYDEKLEFTEALGEKPINYDIIEIIPIELGYSIVAQKSRSKAESFIYVQIEEKKCSDGMSEDEYPLSVYVSINEKQLYGCGRLK
jgi:uncharacterized membrane protein